MCPILSLLRRPYHHACVDKLEMQIMVQSSQLSLCKYQCICSEDFECLSKLADNMKSFLCVNLHDSQLMV